MSGFVPSEVEAAVGGPIDWLDVLEQQARSLEDVAESVDPATPVPGCPGWDVSALLDHVGGVHRMVVGWTSTGRRSARSQRPADVAALAWYAEGWRTVLQHLAATGPTTRVPTWSPSDDTAAFWYRRMAHETAIHALDAWHAAGRGDAWTLPDAVAADGVDEALRLFLACRLGPAGGNDSLVQVRVPGRWWAVSLHASVVEVGEPEPGPFADLMPDAVVRGPARHVYRWVWGREDDTDPVVSSGDHAATEALRAALARATQ